MAQSGFTPISNYYSATAASVPTAGNLVAGELALNTADGKLFYKDSAGVVQTLASKSTTSGVFTSVTDSGLTSGRVTYATTGGLLTDSANLVFDGTNLTSGSFIPSSGTAPTNGMYLATTNSLGFATSSTERMRITSAGGVSFGATGTAYGTSGQVLTSSGNAPPTWTTVASGGVSSLAAGTGISVSASTGAVTVTNAGVTSVTAGTGISVSASTGGVTISSTGGSTPTWNQVGSYMNGVVNGQATAGSNYSAGSGTNQARGFNSYGDSTSVSGTWQWMSATATVSSNNNGGVMLRIA